ncbi:MAG: extracellular solute-binding protein [Anaerolineaceae bacterium]|nr:extracellular solute-binding protein [Anaerolineaceae bacterium]
MKRILLKLLPALLVISFIATACAPAAPAVAPTEAAAPAEAAATEVPEVEEEPTATLVPTEAAPVDIELWAGGRVTEAGPPPDDWAAYDIIANELNINLKLVLLPSTQADQDTKINAAGASNSLPDLFMVNRDTWYKLVQAGLIAKVDDLLPLMPVRTETHYSDVDRNKLVTIDGAMYGLPDPGAMPSTDGLVIRQDWLDKLGLESPTTLDEFMEVAQAFTFDDPDGNGKNDTYGFCGFIDGSGLSQAGLGPRFDFIYGAYGVPSVWNLSSLDDFQLNVRSENFMKATQFIKEMNDAKVIDPDWPTLKKDEFRARWKQGSCGMMHENFAALANQSNYKDFDTNFPDGQWVVMDPPKGPDGDSAEGVIIKTARIYAISQKALDEGKGEAIARLLEWMANDEGYYLLGFGVEGVNYNLDDNGYITTEGLADADKWTSKEAQPLTQLANMVYVFNDVELKARYVAYKTQNGRDMDPLAYYNAFVEMPWVQATGASVINPPSNAADFTRFYSENLVQFVLGQKPLDEASWAEYIAGLDSLGAKELEADAKQTLITTGFLK